MGFPAKQYPRLSVRLTQSDYGRLDRLRSAYALPTRSAALKRALRIAVAYQFEDPESLIDQTSSDSSTRPFVIRLNPSERSRLHKLWSRYTMEPGYKLRCALRLAALRKGVVYDKSFLTAPVRHV